MLGIGGNINANTIAQLAGGKVFNPYTEQLFSNMTFRSHGLTLNCLVEVLMKQEKIS